MEYDIELIVDAPVEAVWRIITDAETWPRWQLGLGVVAQVGGEPGAPGSVRELRFDLPGRDMSMRETIVRVEADTRYDARYDAGPVHNVCGNALSPFDGGTRWVQSNTWFFDGVDASDDDRERFIATTTATMHDLKAYVEHGTEVPRIS